MDVTIKQLVALHSQRLTWELPQNTNKLCHRCGKLGCAFSPTACPINNFKGRSHTHNPVAHLKERFNIGQPPKISHLIEISNAPVLNLKIVSTFTNVTI
ncbi:hypothetical protein RIR_jg23863.t1 [Rhizophagus irregularis DAOM 181602=DAOM 197198]|uniref:Uncharacterized protein n=1 Tax=Rhizophagus irregularis (strain DAOM 197198w) TaxID=1432141 RepID=A0A015MMQ5_RHIIW|nr:hypothetical protein RirG_108320 [Rhizophagus irregularis DAOM 197198w]GBC30134.1 hypothetical protein RIR_jg23863.t1 [Rhizophagus irregularis DAOM 181602=DAOM 197198]